MGNVLRFLALFVLAALTVGFGIFAVAITTQEAAPDARADAIVVLTGGGARVETGLRLLEEGRGDRLLISGVSPEVSAEDIRAMAPPDAARFDCCVDLDRVAEDTAANARETANWARMNGYQRVLLVTQSYHMPRARLELARAAPEIAFTPYPVGGWRDAGLRRALVEYAKLLIVGGREAILRLRSA